MVSHLSPYRLGKAREVFNYFNVTNAISYNLLVGSIITLFAMRLSASATYIGLISASGYIALFFPPIGKLLSRRFSLIGIFGFTWTARALCMVPAVLAPIVASYGYRDVALVLVVFAVFAFHICRGIGLISNNPVLSALAVGPDRGSYLTQLQVVNSAASISGSFVMAMILGRDPPIFIYSILLGTGVVTGVMSGFMIRKVPEPPGENTEEKLNLVSIFRDALAQDGLKRFLAIFFIVVLVSGVSRAFVIVYAREVFRHSDGLVSLYTVFGGLGYLMIGMFSKFLVDRIGAKPIFIVCVIIGLVSMIPIVFFPVTGVDNITSAILFLAFLFFMLNFTFNGAEGIGQTYFLALVPTEKMVDIGILYFFIYGIAGAGGSFLAGLFLDIFSAVGVSSFISFKILFAVLIVLTIIALILQKGLKSLGSLSLKSALEVIFSFRDLRAISLLDKLNKAQDSQEEAILLGALHNTPSKLATDGLLERTRSPRFVTRMEAIMALEKLEGLNENAKKALMDDIVKNHYTTAYISARILGNHRCTAAIPQFRELAFSGDYMLACEAILALAKMGDESFRQKTERLLLEAENPRLKITCAEALGIYKSPSSLTVLLDSLRGEDPPPYLRDEIILAMSAILDTDRNFYPVFVRYSADNSLAGALGTDEAEAAYESYKSSVGDRKKLPEAAIDLAAKKIHGAVAGYIKNKEGADLSKWILELPDDLCGAEIRDVLSGAVLDDVLNAHNRLRLLIVHWAACQLRNWTTRARNQG